MEKTSFGTNDVIVQVLEKYADMVRRICFLYLRQSVDVEDVFQEVFLKLLQNPIQFESEEHVKAWLCRVTINQCKDLCRSFFRKKVCSLDDLEVPTEDKRLISGEESSLIVAVLNLPPKFRDLVYLHYYEEYTVPEISQMLHQKENTIYSYLHRARKLLKKQLGGSENEFDTEVRSE